MDKNAEAVAFGGCPAFLPEEIDLFFKLGLYRSLSVISLQELTLHKLHLKEV